MLLTAIIPLLVSLACVVDSVSADTGDDFVRPGYAWTKGNSHQSKLARRDPVTYNQLLSAHGMFEQQGNAAAAIQTQAGLSDFYSRQHHPQDIQGHIGHHVGQAHQWHAAAQDHQILAVHHDSEAERFSGHYIGHTANAANALMRTGDRTAFAHHTELARAATAEANQNTNTARNHKASAEGAYVVSRAHRSAALRLGHPGP